MAANPQPIQFRFTVDEYYRLYEEGILKHLERADIIDGKLYETILNGNRHAATVKALNKFFAKNVFDGIFVSVQNPVRLNDYHKLEPDLALADLTKYDGKRHSQPAEILLIVEVADTTLDYDRKTKIPLYAEAELPVFRLINLRNNTVQVYTNPLEGAFGLVKVLRAGERLQSETVPNLSIEVDRIFGDNF